MKHLFSTLIAGWLALVPALCAVDTNSPEAELASFKVRDGYQVTLFASEADGIVNPIQFRFDPQGRLYVSTSTVYPQVEPGQIPDDKIFRLEDKNGDGKADDIKIFARGLMIPTGLELGDHGLYVGSGTELLHFKDIDGDGVADERRVVLRGFGTGDAHQNINSFAWSPGGELWFSQGLHGFARVETPWGISKLDQAGIWRLQPRRLKLDSFFGDGLPPHNPWGFAWDDWGQPFVAAGNGHGIYYTLPILIPGHGNFQLPQVWIDQRGRKVCGVDIVSTSHLPDDLQGTLIAGGFMNNAVYAMRILEEGSGFKLVDQEPLIISTHTSFRPVDVKVGPDGSIYVADWYNPIIGHYQASFRHPDRDKTHGRIWRITAKGRSLVKPPNLNGPLPTVLDALKSTERWPRYQAKRVLADADTASVTNALAQWLAQLKPSDPAYEHYLFEALGVYETHEVVEPHLLNELLHAKDYRARAYAAGVVGRWSDRLKDPLGMLAPLAADPSSRVRLATVVAAATVPQPEAVSVAATVADQPMDMFLEYALKQAVYVLKPHWLPALNANKLSLTQHPKRLEAVLRADASPDTLKLVRAQLQSTSLPRETRASFLSVLAAEGAPDDLASLLKSETFQQGKYDAALQAQMLLAMTEAARLRTNRASGDATAAVRSLLNQPDEAVRAGALRLAGAWKLEGLRPSLKETAEAKTATVPLRLAAINGLSGLGGAGSVESLAQLGREEKNASVQLAAVRALAPLATGRAAEIAAGLFAADVDGKAVNELLPSFLQRKDGATVLAKALAAHPPARDAARLALQLLTTAGRSDGPLLEVLNKAAGWSNEPLKMSPEEIKQLMGEIAASGDARRGADIFRRADVGCITCHAVAGQGGNIGPDLGAIGRAQPLDFIIGAVLEPNREVKEGFESIEVETKNGETYQGFKVRVERTEIVLRDALQNREVRISTANIKQQINRGSLMPAGLVDRLTRAEMRDLFRYLSELGKTQ